MGPLLQCPEGFKVALNFVESLATLDSGVWTRVRTLAACSLGDLSAPRVAGATMRVGFNGFFSRRRFQEDLCIDRCLEKLDVSQQEGREVVGTPGQPRAGRVPPGQPREDPVCHQ